MTPCELLLIASCFILFVAGVLVVLRRTPRVDVRLLGTWQADAGRTVSEWGSGGR